MLRTYRHRPASENTPFWELRGDHPSAKAMDVSELLAFRSRLELGWVWVSRSARHCLPVYGFFCKRGLESYILDTNEMKATVPRTSRGTVHPLRRWLARRCPAFRP